MLKGILSYFLNSYLVVFYKSICIELWNLSIYKYKKSMYDKKDLKNVILCMHFI